MFGKIADAGGLRIDSFFFALFLFSFVHTITYDSMSRDRNFLQNPLALSFGFFVSFCGHKTGLTVDSWQWSRVGQAERRVYPGYIQGLWVSRVVKGS